MQPMVAVLNTAPPVLTAARFGAIEMGGDERAVNRAINAAYERFNTWRAQRLREDLQADRGASRVLVRSWNAV